MKAHHRFGLFLILLSLSMRESTWTEIVIIGFLVFWFGVVLFLVEGDE